MTAKPEFERGAKYARVIAKRSIYIDGMSSSWGGKVKGLKESWTVVE